MDAAQETRVAEITAQLQKRGPDEVTGGARRALADELTTLLTGPAASPAAIAPEKQARLDEITAQLRDQATTSDPTKLLTVTERNDLAREASDILLSAGGDDAAGNGDGAS